MNPATAQPRTRPASTETSTDQASTDQASDTHHNPPHNLLAHPQLWRAGQLARRQVQSGLPSGYPALDAQLPGGGWPRAGLAEVLHAQPGLGELRLLAPMLADLSQDENRWIAWVNPPATPYAPALGRFGIRSDRLLMIHPKNHTDALWAAEQAARSGSCSAVLIWLDEAQLKNSATRRLQIAAKQGGSLACLFRPGKASIHASAAELRLALHAPLSEAQAEASEPLSGYSHMQVDVLKRQGGWAVNNIDIELAGDDPIRRLQEIQQQLSIWRESRRESKRESRPAKGPAAGKQARPKRQQHDQQTLAQLPLTQPPLTQPPLNQPPPTQQQALPQHKLH